MTRTELTTDIHQLERRADEAREDGNAAMLYRTLCEIEALQGEMDVQPHEFGGGE